MPPSDIPPAYAAGQRWHCEGRQPGERPTVLINRIDQHPLGGRIFHITLDGLQLRHRGLPGGVMTRLAHAPVTEQTFARSGMVYEGPHPAASDYRKGYDEWRRAFDAGNAGAFDISVAALLDTLEQQLAQRHPAH
ncbi:hypothetical protein [Stenotrophomonas mori]|uniref:Uncharacterized protein n=1 Tax=Stenotrophomonas mori TaxID=2871096 RepID=A0ABT0SDS9_9GAMM|nr:hypothetical protein [Stenotrophomonas mori]MCL7713485.1 hypothetical protein [Stenotrophomonas mori]